MSLHEHCYVVPSMHYRIIFLAMFIFLAGTVSAIIPINSSCSGNCTPGSSINTCCSGKLIPNTRTHTSSVSILTLILSDNRNGLRVREVCPGPSAAPKHWNLYLCMTVTESHCMVCPTATTYQPFEIAILDAVIPLELKLNLDISMHKESIHVPRTESSLPPPPCQWMRSESNVIKFF